MLEAVKLPTRVSDLDTSLTDVDRDALPHFRLEIRREDDDEEEDEIGGRV